MRSYVTEGATVSNKAGASFAFQGKAADVSVQFKMAAVFALALLTMVAAGMMSLHPSNASQAENLTSLQHKVFPPPRQTGLRHRSFRSCNSQAWGAWSEECAASLTGASKVRNVSFVTVEQKAPTANQTILARYPTTN